MTKVVLVVPDSDHDMVLERTVASRLGRIQLKYQV
jgi:hypothetical protein